MAEAAGIRNQPSKEHLANLKMTALGLEQIRAFLQDKPVTITSGYRCTSLNELVGGVANSDHTLGYAADITVAPYTALQLGRLIEGSAIAYDQLVYEPDRNVVHVSFNPKLRRASYTQLGMAGTPFLAGVHHV